jgi:hypothetical protein
VQKKIGLKLAHIIKENKPGKKKGPRKPGGKVIISEKKKKAFGDSNA